MTGSPNNLGPALPTGYWTAPGSKPFVTLGAPRAAIWLQTLLLMSHAQDGSFLARSGTACHTARTSAAQIEPAVVTVTCAAPEPAVVAAIRVKTPIGAAVPPPPIERG